MNPPETIECRICQKAKPDFDRINRRINDARTAAEKISPARELLEKVEAVLKEHENVDSALAQVCRRVLNLRKQAAELILKFEKRGNRENKEW
jgi:hypothetical protein